MLQGSLEDFQLSDVLGLLADTGKSGRLRLTGDRGTGSLWLEDGALVSGIVGVRTDAVLEEMVFELMRFGTGDFSFSADERPIQAGEPRMVSEIVAEAGSRLEEWRQIAAVVPSLAHAVRPIAELPSEEMVITRREWQVLLAVGPVASVDAVCTALEMGEVDGSRQVKALVDRGLLLVADPVAAPTSSTASSTADMGPAGADDDVVEVPSSDSIDHGSIDHGSIDHEVAAEHDAPVFADQAQDGEDQFAPLADGVIDFGTNGDASPLEFGSKEAPAPEHRIEFPAPVSDVVAPLESDPFFHQPAEDQGFVFDAEPEDAGFAAPEGPVPVPGPGRSPMPPPPVRGGFTAGLGAPASAAWGVERPVAPAEWQQDHPEMIDDGSDWTPENEVTPTTGFGTIPPPPPPGPGSIPVSAPPALGGVPAPPPPPAPRSEPGPVFDQALVSEHAPVPIPNPELEELSDETQGSGKDESGVSLLMRYLKSER